jgi:POT family proton-dependent oligopeptide transporter
MSDSEKRFPPQIKYIIGNEAAERFSFYGMRSILVIFMVKHLLMKDNESESVFHLFVSAAYFFPLIGGWISDRFWGKYNTIMRLSMVYCLGHLVLALRDDRTGLYAGLALIAIGSGGIKACVSAHVGDQFTSKNKSLVAKVFDLFYFSVNFGSFFSTLLIPWILPRYGSSVAFGIPGILMAIATFVFWMGRDKYVHVPPTKKTGAVGFVPVFWYALTHAGQRKRGQSFFDTARAKFKGPDVEACQAAANVFKVFITVSIFWALFDQHSSSWVLQATKMNLNVLGYKMEASQIAALNPIMVLILIPLFSGWMYPLITRMGFEMRPLRRMGVGMVVAASSFAVVAAYQILLDHGVFLSVAWQVIPFLLLTGAEVMISITGLEFAYTQAPRSMKSTIMSFWLLTVFAGNLLTAYIAAINVFSGATYFLFFSGLMAAVSLIFMWTALNYKTKDYFEEALSGQDLAIAET